jgi:hypothetical protein
VVDPGTTHNPEAPPPITAADIQTVCTAVAAEIAEAYALSGALAANLRECLCTEVTRGGAFTDRALQHYAERGALCLLLHLETCAGPGGICDASQRDLADEIADSFDRHTTRWRSKGFRQRGGIARVAVRRARRARPPRGGAGASCGSKHKHWAVDPGLAVRLDWLRNNCGGGKSRKATPAVGGTLAQARRAGGLWDASTAADEQGRGPGAGGPLSSGVINRDTAAALAASTAAAAEAAENMTRARVAEWGSPNRSGYSPCQAPGAAVSCFSPETGLDRRWTMVGRSFTKEEVGHFLRTQCTPQCGFVPIERGMPAGAKAGIRRVAPRNPAVARRFDCAKTAPPALVPKLALRPLPTLDSNAAAVWVPPAACQPDIVIGADTGMFGSGWYRVIRRGATLMVPWPELCGGPMPNL